MTKKKATGGKRYDEYGLTALWRSLCDEVLQIEGEDGKAAYMRIRPNATPRTAEVESSKILSRPECRAYLSMRKEEISQKSMKDAVYLRERLAEELEADILDLYAEDGSFLPIKSWPKIWRQGLVTEIVFSEDPELKGIPVKLKVKGRDKVMELFGRHADIGAFADLPTNPSEVHVHVHAPE